MYDIKKDFEWFKENREEIIKGHENKRVVIQNCEVKGYYDSDEEAINAMLPIQEGNYIVQRCLSAEKDIEYYFTGRYAFS